MISTTYQACMTPAGSGALATLTLYGPSAWQVVCQSFRPRAKKTLPECVERTPPAHAGGSPSDAGDSLGHQFWLGNLGEGHGDEVVVCLKQTMPVPHVEVHCHGGHEVVRYLQEHFESLGVTRLSWQEMTRRIEGGPCRSAALIELAQAPTARTASILLDQLNGAFTQALVDIRSAIDKKEYDQARQHLIRLAGRASLGRHLTKPWRVVLAGAPNVGKSSLANRLAGYMRSVVSPTPGTTRDVVTTPLALDGWPVEVADTAGIREARETLEGQGVALAKNTVAHADLCLWLLDASHEPVWPEEKTKNLQLVINKIDLAPIWDLEAAALALRVSAETGEGVIELGSQIACWLVPNVPEAGSAVPFNEEISERVEDLLRDCEMGEFETLGKKIDAFLVQCSVTPVNSN